MMRKNWKTIPKTFLLSGLIFFYALAANAVDFPYLSQGINRINNIFHKSPSLSDEDLLDVARIACNTITELVKDPEFDQMIERLSASKLAATPEDLRQIFRDLNQLSAFLEIEYMQARANGYSALTSFDMINSILATPVESISPQEPAYIAANIRTLRSRFCDIAYGSKVNTEQAEAIRHGVFGVGVFVIDVGLTHTGFLLPVAYASWGVAMTFIGEALIKLG